MYIYNVTVNIDTDVHDEWLEWMKNHHIPEVMETGMFLNNRICKVMVDEESGFTYSFQYLVKDLETLQLYQQLHAPRLQGDVNTRYANKFVAFRTVLEVVKETNAPDAPSA